MKIIFTICSNNYLAQAKVLEKSIKKHNPNYIFYLCLVDSILPKIDYPIHTIESDKIGIENFDFMVLNYNIIELNTAVKPFFIQYLFNKYSESEHITYLDPDIKIYSNLDFIDINLSQFDLLLTPHAISPLPIDDDLFPKENLFLNHGIYNLGFVSFKNSKKSIEILDWWRKRLSKHCICDLKEGYFVDQLWMNLAPIYFEKNTKVLFHKGLNVAFWNLHERNIFKDYQSQFYIESFPLIFFHFSGYKPSIKTEVAKNQNRITFNLFPILKELFEDYNNELLEFNYNFQTQIVPIYTKIRKNYLQQLEIEKRSTLKGYIRFQVSEMAKFTRKLLKKIEK